MTETNESAKVAIAVRLVQVVAMRAVVDAMCRDCADVLEMRAREMPELAERKRLLALVDGLRYPQS